MRAQLMLSLLLAIAGLPALAAPEIRSSNTVTYADGSRLELHTRFQARTRDALTLNQVVIQVEMNPPDPVRPGATDPPEPVRYRIEGRASSGIGEIDPCWTPALFLMAKGYVDARQVFDALGLSVQVAEVTGDGSVSRDRATDAAILDLMVAQVAVLRPDRAALVARLVADAGFSSGALCLPASRQ
jgi:hypothetical protein